MTIYIVLGYSTDVREWVVLSVHSSEALAEKAIAEYPLSQNYTAYDVIDREIDESV